jgi:hypothetical protein
MSLRAVYYHDWFSDKCCRDTSKVLDAVQKYQAGHVEEALRLLEDSTRIIDEIVRAGHAVELELCFQVLTIFLGRNVGHGIRSDLW